jgi:hypothetical protein
VTFAFLGLYVVLGLLCALWTTYALTDPCAGPPTNQDALYTLLALLAWPAMVVVGLVGLVMDWVWEKRRAAYYGGQVRG